MLTETECLKKISYLKGFNDQTYYAFKLPLHRDPFHSHYYKGKIYLQMNEKGKDNHIYTDKQSIDKCMIIVTII